MTILWVWICKVIFVTMLNMKLVSANDRMESKKSGGESHIWWLPRWASSLALWPGMDRNRQTRLCYSSGTFEKPRSNFMIVRLYISMLLWYFLIFAYGDRDIDIYVCVKFTCSQWSIHTSNPQTCSNISQLLSNQSS
jgi:hypothetical protein